MDGYILNDRGAQRIFTGDRVFFSIKDFSEKICSKGNCFVCGIEPHKSFNNEHVFPNWLLKHSDLKSAKFNLPNGSEANYATYKIPCCSECNSKLGMIYEEPVSNAFRNGYEGIYKFLHEQNGIRPLLNWLSLLFTKVHLRDFRNNISLDKRTNTGVIGDAHNLHSLHHIHAVARSETAGISVDEEVYGSFYLLRAEKPKSDLDRFNYFDSLEDRAMFLQVDDIAIIYTLDDAGGVADKVRPFIHNFPNPAPEKALKALFRMCAAANRELEPPEFVTELSHFGPRIIVKPSMGLTNEQTIDAHFDQLEVNTLSRIDYNFDAFPGLKLSMPFVGEVESNNSFRFQHDIAEQASEIDREISSNPLNALR